MVVNNTISIAADGRWALNIQDGSTGNTVLNNILLQRALRSAARIDDLGRQPARLRQRLQRRDRPLQHRRRFHEHDPGGLASQDGPGPALVHHDAGGAVRQSGGGDYHLKAGSPAINTGTASLCGKGVTHDGPGEIDSSGWRRLRHRAVRIPAAPRRRPYPTPTPTPTPTPSTVFSTTTGTFGDFANYQPLTASRWSVVDDNGNARLFLNTTSYSELSGSRLGEYAP